jgi:hypothetical protein
MTVLLDLEAQGLAFHFIMDYNEMQAILGRNDPGVKISNYPLYETRFDV